MVERKKQVVKEYMQYDFTYKVKKQACVSAKTNKKPIRQGNDLKKNQDDGYLLGEGGDGEGTAEVQVMCS